MFGKDGPSFRELLQQALSSTEKGYDLLAPKFDTTPFRTPDAVIDRALEDLGEVESAIDLCCGTGAALVPLRNHATKRLVGVDFSQGMLDIARKRLDETASRVKVELVKSDVFALTMEGELDLATCFGAHGHILPDNEGRFVEIVRRLLKRGGRFVFVTGRHPPLLSKRNLVGRAFNAAMHVRNAFISPPFIMYYLTFLLPEAERLLKWHGFDVRVDEGLFPEPFEKLVRVIATRP
jgi:ubiquinone/menaquinone biosynthesis C-methylase UbiE